MAARSGEDVAAILFADVHYYYGAPTAKPPHHRFDKGSYVYLFENAAQRRARLEIANNAGTPDQDAFNGYFDGAHVRYSYKHTNLVSLTVDTQNDRRNSSGTDGQEWHLPSFDERNENKYMYKLHAVDIYFWTKEDAIQFVNSLRRVLPQQQVTVLDEPVAPPPHSDAMSSIVQNLENVAISDPSYQQGRTRDSRNIASAFPGPPISATPQSQEAQNFAPLAYNPAAPAAPEAIKHREKTPPPEDGTPNPLAAAATSDQGQTYGTSYQHPGQPGFSGPPPNLNHQGSYFTGPPSAAPVQQQHHQFAASAGPQAGYPSNFAQQFQQTPSFAAPPTSASGGNYQHHTNPPPGPPAYQKQSHVPVTQYANYPGSPGIASPMTSPGIYSPGLSQTHTAPGIYSPGVPPPPGGFAQFSYGQQQATGAPLMSDYAIHQQVYRPTEAEATSKMKPAKPARGKLEEKAGQIEKGVGSLFKKLEKRIG